MTTMAHSTTWLMPDDGSSWHDRKPARPEAQTPLKSVGAQRGLPHPFADASNEMLVAAALEGNRWAQREVWDRFAPMIKGLLQRTLGPRPDVEDIMQEVFLRVFRRLHSIEKPSALPSFIFSIGVRVLSEKTRHFQMVRQAFARFFSIPTEGQATCDFEARDSLRRIQRVLDGMGKRHRVVFVLRHADGLELKEIADKSSFSLASVKRYLDKATCEIKRAAESDPDLRDALAPYSSNLDAGEGS